MKSPSAVQNWPAAGCLGNPDLYYSNFQAVSKTPTSSRKSFLYSSSHTFGYKVMNRSWSCLKVVQPNESWGSDALLPHHSHLITHVSARREDDKAWGTDPEEHCKALPVSPLSSTQAKQQLAALKHPTTFAHSNLLHHPKTVTHPFTIPKIIWQKPGKTWVSNSRKQVPQDRLVAKYFEYKRIPHQIKITPDLVISWFRFKEAEIRHFQSQLLYKMQKSCLY